MGITKATETKSVTVNIFFKVEILLCWLLCIFSRATNKWKQMNRKIGIRGNALEINGYVRSDAPEVLFEHSEDHPCPGPPVPFVLFQQKGKLGSLLQVLESGVANWCCDAELERSVLKHSIYVLMDYELYQSNKKPNYCKNVKGSLVILSFFLLSILEKLLPFHDVLMSCKYCLNLFYSWFFALFVTERQSAASFSYPQLVPVFLIGARINGAHGTIQSGVRK